MGVVHLSLGGWVWLFGRHATVKYNPLSSANPMEEPLARVEIHRHDSDLFTAEIWSETEGSKELRASNLDTLLRELTMDLEFAAGEHTREGRGLEFSAEEEFENLQYAEEWSG